MNNPFSLTFGMEPTNYIDRSKERDEIITDFSDDISSNYAYLLTGIRGCGKTVFMYSIANALKNDNRWIIANIGPKIHMLDSLAAEIYEQGKLKKLFLKTEFSYSFKGFGFSIEGSQPVSDIMTLLKRMLEYLKKKNKKVLITIDEVDNSDDMKYFIQGYAALLGQKYLMYLLMTGLYENVSKLQNEKSLTFLYRTPKIQLSPLSIANIGRKYSSLLNISYDKALEISKLTKGYAYAYQVLGYLLYENKKTYPDDEILFLFDQYMEEYVYDKVYSEISNNCKLIIKSMKEDKNIKIKDIALKLNKTTQYISVYRDILIKEGIIYSPSYGYIQFALPRFDIFLKSK